jgi:hypothetical protein
MQPTDEPHSMLGRRSDGVEMSLIAGWQIVTSERLEVLVLCCPRPAIPDGLPFQATLGEAMQSDGVTVVPWGFGKWWFGRGRLVSDMMTQHGSAIFLGDNRGRPRSGIDPWQFTLAYREGIRLLPGTDPLPFPSQVDHVGRFGFLVPQIVDRSRPAENIKRLIRDGRQPECYGQRQSLPQFCQHQLTLRWSRMCRRLSA